MLIRLKNSTLVLLPNPAQDYFIINNRVEEENPSSITPVLALPQVTHYILDSFIWKIKKEH